jgi:hypothetical protein
MTDSLEFPQNKAYQQEFVQDVETKKPKYLVYYKSTVSWLPQPRSIRIIENWFAPYAYRYYKVVGIADMVATDKTEYVWNDEAANYQPKGKYFVVLFERKV